MLNEFVSDILTCNSKTAKSIKHNFKIPDLTGIPFANNINILLSSRNVHSGSDRKDFSSAYIQILTPPPEI